MPLPLISIIIPVYNSEKFIADTISSALSQSYREKEIIIVDDGSSDRTFDLAKTFESAGPVKVIKQQNSGACAARNNAFKESKGELIQYLDADDMLSPDKVINQYNLLKELPSGFISSCSWAFFTDDVSQANFVPQPVWKDLSPVEWLTTAWQGGGMMQTACWLTPRWLIEAAGPWNESLKKNPNDDGEFFCRVLLKSRGIKYCGDSKVYYRKHEGERVSTYKDRQAIESLLNSYISYEEHILPVDRSQEVLTAVAKNYAVFIYQYYLIFPDLATIAENRIRSLGVKTPLIGNRYFRSGMKLLGLKNMLHVRKFAKRFV
jgi:glycosyltransferase involved in cell wall biosynthesis